MKTIFDYYNDLGIDHNINFEEFITEKNMFYFIQALPKSVIDQMATEEIEDTDAFFNNDCAESFMTLLKYDKVSPQGFDHIIRGRDLFYRDRSKNSEIFEKLCYEFILKNNVDVTTYFYQDRLNNNFEEILMECEGLNPAELLRRVDLEKALKKNSIALLLFGMQVGLYNKDIHADQVQFIKDNYDLIAPVFFTECAIWQVVRPHYFVKKNYEGFLHKDCLEIILRYFEIEELVELDNKVLLEKKFHYLVDTKYVEDATKLLELCAEKFPDLVAELKCDPDYKESFIAYNETITIDEITQENFELVMKQVSPMRRKELVTDINLHKKINSVSFFKDFRNHMYYSDWSEELVQFYIDLCNKIHHTEQGKDWSFNRFKDDVYITALTLAEKPNTEWAHKFVVQCLESELFREGTVFYIQENGKFKLFEFVANEAPELAKTLFDHKKLLDKVIVSSVNNSDW